MMLEPAHCAGDAPRTPSEQGTAEESSDAESPRTPAADAVPDHPIRLPTPDPALDACRRLEREQWRRRRRLERQLHDGPALRISALTLQIGLIRHQTPAGGADLHESIDAVQEELHAVLQELRHVAGQIYPPLLDQAGLGPALREVADCMAIPTLIHAADDRFDPAAEGAAYLAVTGCLDSLDSDAAPVDVRIRRETDQCGGCVLAVDVAEVNLRHAEPMLEHVWRLGGTIDVIREQDVGTIMMRIACE